MPSEFPYDVFLSHSAKDKAIVRPLAERLRKDGLKVWFDEWELPVAASRQSAAFSTEGLAAHCRRVRAGRRSAGAVGDPAPPASSAPLGAHRRPPALDTVRHSAGINPRWICGAAVAHPP